MRTVGLEVKSKKTKKTNTKPPKDDKTSEDNKPSEDKE